MSAGNFGINPGQYIVFTKDGATGIGNSAYLSFLNAASTNGVSFSLNANNDLSWYGTNGGTQSAALGVITKVGNFGIGTISPTEIGSYKSLTIDGIDGSILDLRLNGSNNGRIFTNAGAGLVLESISTTLPTIFSTNGAERMRITSVGQVQVKQSTNNFDSGIAITNTLNNTWQIVNAGDNALYLGYNAISKGNFSASSGVYTPLSDINKKKEFELSTIGLDAIMGLKPTLYRFKDDINSELKKDLGFIAQEVKDFIPQAYVESQTENETFIGLNYNAITAALVKAIQELNQKIQAQQQQINSLINR
jgi:hypothetical protein